MHIPLRSLSLLLVASLGCGGVDSEGDLQAAVTLARAGLPAVTWSLAEAGCGSITPAGLFTAPAVSSSTTCHVLATISGISGLASILVGGTTPSACVTNPAETFAGTDAPGLSSGFTTPWGYGRRENSARSYPLVVNGCWAEGPYFTTDIRQKYPAFYLDWNNHCSSDDDGVQLADKITAAIAAGLRIDLDRIYLTGFSQGGSGSYKLVRGMLTRGMLFAGIIRVAGQSEPVLADQAVARTSIWYHIGLKDDAARIAVANEAYAYVKNRPENASAVETTVTDTAGTWARTTKTLTKDGIAIFRLSTYPAGQHDPAPAYAVPQAPASMNVFDWLFSQSLACR